MKAGPSQKFDGIKGANPWPGPQNVSATTKSRLRLQSLKSSIKLVFSSVDALDAHYAGMAELADAADSKSAGLRSLGVRFPLPAPIKSHITAIRRN
ncbi:hypothetical protein SBA1_1300002 [Candidatus Sulfotelmatobacter kueseliae]|uniref:Uncharacterized protein n=1 Tax=Candidatus Sulfotelmatobacter kueseliae TaxID=2042962 RepID=A0A2U3K4N0_9BACT|nr:hypothetical protein SBA1_1300002 [Candidatus Sulfotelmatobacter kueseliae]